MGMSSYENALKWLDTFQFHGYRLGLERMEAILDALGRPERRYPSIHVAGTNGKGSVCATCQTFAMEAGLKCGFYSSPHLHSLNERFRVNDRLVDDKSLAALIFRIKELVKAGYELSYFEYTTVIAMLWFMEQEVDMAVFETGLGGRLDATNVITPACTVITNISLDHQAWLGDSVKDIAFEKAGIIKAGVPVVSGVAGEPARGVIAGTAMERGAGLFEAGRDFQLVKRQGNVFDYHGLRHSVQGLAPSMRGSHQMDNLALALAAWELFCAREDIRTVKSFGQSVRKGVEEVKWPGRGECISGSPFILLDGAHNPDGIRALKRLLGESMADRAAAPEDMALLWSCSDEGGDKDFVSMLHELAPLFGHIVITEPPGPRKPVSVEMWETALDDAENITFARDWKEGFEKALEMAGAHGGVCVAGSLYLVGAVRNAWFGK